MERLKGIKGMDMEKLKEMVATNPHLRERLSGVHAEMRSRMEEERRMDIEKMRQLQR